MSSKTNIEWCDSTLNFWSGCTKVSPGCAHCYAETLSNNKFFGGGNTIGKFGKGEPRKLHESAFKVAGAMNRKPWICDKCGEAYSAPMNGQVIQSPCCGEKLHRRRIFSLSLGDWLDAEVPIEWLARMLNTIRQCENVVWILCTKRPENFIKRFNEVGSWILEHCHNQEDRDAWIWTKRWKIGSHIPSNIILLTSVENQAMADKRIPELLKIHAAYRGLSLEPLLGPIEFSDVTRRADAVSQLGKKALAGIDWLILGGESGTGARPCDTQWIRSLVDQGKASGVATFVKQLGANPVCKPLTQNRICPIPLKDKKGGDITEWPAALRIMEFPML